MSTADLDGLYQQLILDHARTPHGYGLVADATGRSSQVNPLCGDEVTITVVVENDTVAGLGWEGRGCAISQASASLFAGLIEGRSVADTTELIAEFRVALHSRGQIELDEARFGDAVALSGVSRYLARIKCAMLPCVALEAALAG